MSRRSDWSGGSSTSKSGMRCANTIRLLTGWRTRLWIEAASRLTIPESVPNCPLPYTQPSGLPLRRHRHPQEDDTMIGAQSFAGINFWAVLVCAIATMVIGFLWYSPMLFANPWMRLMGIDPNDKAKLAEMQKGAGKTYGLAFVASIASAVVLAKIIELTSVNTIPYGMKIGFAVWLGFVTTVQLTGALFGK